MKLRLFSVLFVICLLVSCSQKYDNPEEISYNPINTDIVSNSPSLVPTATSTTINTPTNSPTLKPTPKPSQTKSVSSEKNTNTSVKSNPSDKKETIVYITKTGEKYHKDGCQYLSKSKIPISLKDATLKGYDACSVCYSSKSSNSTTIQKFDETHSVNNPGSSIEDTKEVTVYVTKTGEKYHNSGCSYLRKSCIPMNLSDAKSGGYTPCSRCHPPQ
jgi:hypothetical protein